MKILNLQKNNRNIKYFNNFLDALEMISAFDIFEIITFMLTLALALCILVLNILIIIIENFGENFGDNWML